LVFDEKRKEAEIFLCLSIKTRYKNRLSKQWLTSEPLSRKNFSHFSNLNIIILPFPVAQWLNSWVIKPKTFLTKVWGVLSASQDFF
jgi:hypothetical protein